MSSLRRVTRYVRGISALQPTDVWLASFPKAGSTWVRFFLCNLVCLTEQGGRHVDFPVLDAMMPALGFSPLHRPWPHQVIPRTVKTHRPYLRPLFGRAGRAVYIARDPRDIMVSYYHFCRANRRYDVTEPFSDFIRDSRLGLEACLTHFLSWEPHIDLLLQYERLRQDTYDEFRRLTDFLQADVDEAIIRESIERSSFAQVRAVQERSGLSQPGAFEPEYRFARKGISNEWLDYFTPRDVEYYRQLRVSLGFRLYE